MSLRKSKENSIKPIPKMSPNVLEWAWNAKRELAAKLVADDKLSDMEIGECVGITDRQLKRWKRHPIFVERINGIIKATRGAIITKGIADKQARVAALDDRWGRMQRVIEARAKELAGECPGGETGLITKIEKTIGKATIIEYAVDVALLREMRETEKQAAQELGQWQEKQELTGKLQLEAIDARTEIASRIARLAERIGSDRSPPGIEQ